MLSSIGSSSSGTGTIFDPQAPAYQAITFAAAGQLKSLQELYLKHPESISRMQRVHPTNEDYFTALHYAFQNKQWAVASFLINRGARWDIAAQKGEKRGTTPIAQLNKIENGLCLLLNGLLEAQEPIQITPFLDLITSPLFSIERRREVINNKELRHALSAKVKRNEALFLMASLLIGSYTWKNIQTDYYPDFFLFEDLDVLPFACTINCSQMIVYASYLTGFKTKREVHELTFRGTVPPSDKENRKLLDPRTDNEARVKIMMPINQVMAQNLGWDKKTKLEQSQDNFKILYLTRSDGFVEHYALMFGDKMIQISQLTKCVQCEPAVMGLEREKNLCHAPNVYAGMLSWHIEK